MSEQAYGNNGGFYLLRSNPRTLAFVSTWLAHLSQQWQARGFEEQHALNEVLRWARKGRHGLRMEAPKLDDRLFVNGKKWTRLAYNGNVSKASAIVIHLNWKKG